MDTGATLRHLATGLKDMRLRISLDSSKDLCLSDLNDVIALLFFAKEAYGPFAWHLRKINGFVRGVFLFFRAISALGTSRSIFIDRAPPRSRLSRSFKGVDA